MSIGMWVLIGFAGFLIVMGFVFRAALAAFVERARVFVREVRTEMKKVSWPTRQEVIGNTIVVLTAVVFLAVLIGMMDSVFALCVGAMFK